MKSHFQFSDEAFETQFKNATLDPTLFSHEAHIRLAWIHLQKYGVEKAIDGICKQLLIYVDTLGARHKYNKTLTVAAIKAVSHFMNKSTSQTFFDFIQEFPRLKYNFRELMACHYQRDIYNSEEAKEYFIEPDLLPFT